MLSTVKFNETINEEVCNDFNFMMLTICVEKSQIGCLYKCTFYGDNLMEIWSKPMKICYQIPRKNEIPKANSIPGLAGQAMFTFI